MLSWVDYFPDNVAYNVVNFHHRILLPLQAMIAGAIFTLENFGGFVECETNNLSAKSFENKLCMSRGLYVNWTISKGQTEFWIWNSYT